MSKEAKTITDDELKALIAFFDGYLITGASVAIEGPLIDECGGVEEGPRDVLRLELQRGVVRITAAFPATREQWEPLVERYRNLGEPK